MSAKRSGVPRPLKKAEFEIQFGASQAEKAWKDLLATTRNSVVDAWDFLTKTPLEESAKNHQLKGELSTLTHKGGTFGRWQHELPAVHGFGSTSTGKPSAQLMCTRITPTPPSSNRPTRAGQRTRWFIKRLQETRPLQ
ncbi:hypothetical protein [Pseudarthrobacter sp. MDT3-1]